MEKGMSCPLCRVKFGNRFAPAVDQLMQLEVRESAPEVFEKRKAYLISQKEWVGSKQLLRFSYGNTYNFIKDADYAFEESQDFTLMHSWSAFFILTKDK